MCDRVFSLKQIWGDSEALSLAQSLGIEDSLKILSSVSDPPKVGRTSRLPNDKYDIEPYY